jgi:GT2 family glycosyltransferase
MYYEDVDLCRKVKHHNKTIALLRDVELQHAHGGSSRRNPKTTAITRSEVVTSSHVSVQAHTQGLNRIALHSTLIINTLISWLFRVFRCKTHNIKQEFYSDFGYYITTKPVYT